MRVAGIDCGTNSIRLLIADAVPGPDGGVRLADVVRHMEVVRLGEGVDRTGMLSPAALERTRLALVDYGDRIRAADAQRVRMVATSATRDAGNRDAFVSMVRDAIGVDPQVISGAEEAALSYAGAVGGLPSLLGEQAPILLADIGGGSTEVVRGAAGQVQAAHSMDVGCVRLTERRLHGDPPAGDEVDAAVADIEAALDAAAADVPLTGASAFVGVAGTVTTLAAIVLGLPAYDPLAIHGATMSAAQVEDVTTMLLGMTRAQRAALPVMHPGRVDVIAGGALVLRTLVRRTESTAVIASEHDILDGIAASIAGG